MDSQFSVTLQNKTKQRHGTEFSIFRLRFARASYFSKRPRPSAQHTQASLADSRDTVRVGRDVVDKVLNATEVSGRLCRLTLRKSTVSFTRTVLLIQSRHVKLAAAYQLSCFIKMFFKKFKICQIFISSFLLNISYTTLLLSDVPCSPKC